MIGIQKGTIILTTTHIYIYDRETFRDYLPSLFLSLIYI